MELEFDTLSNILKIKKEGQVIILAHDKIPNILRELVTKKTYQDENSIYYLNNINLIQIDSTSKREVLLTESEFKKIFEILNLVSGCPFDLDNYYINKNIYSRVTSVGLNVVFSNKTKDLIFTIEESKRIRDLILKKTNALYLKESIITYSNFKLKVSDPKFPSDKPIIYYLAADFLEDLNAILGD